MSLLWMTRFGRCPQPTDGLRVPLRIQLTAPLDRQVIHLKEDLFVEMDEYIKRANGSTDPEVIAACNNILVAKPLSGSIIGMAMRYSTLAVVAVNGRLDKLWHNYALMHEITHVARGHIDDPAFALHQDKGIFTQPVDSRTIPRHELEANLVSAEYSVDTNSVFCLIGYDNSTMRDYRSLKKHQARLTQAYDTLRFSTDVNQSSNAVKYRMAEYRRALMELDEKRQDLESDISSMNCVLSFSEIAHEINTTEIILKYKLEAMRIRGYDIDIQELERYDRVFQDAK